MGVRLTWTDCDEAGDYVVPNVLSQRDLVSRPDNMDETVLHTKYHEELFECTFLTIKCMHLFITNNELWINIKSFLLVYHWHMLCSQNS